MNGSDILTLVTVFVLSAFVGFEVISKVPSVLHTPLMSGTNAIHGVVLVGSMTVLGTAHGAIEITLGFIAVVLSTINVVGGFVVTDRMLEMFKGRSAAPARGVRPNAAEPAEATPAPAPAATTGTPAPAAATPAPAEAPAAADTQPVVAPPPEDPDATRVMEAPAPVDDTTVIPPEDLA
jgi:NAD(P) transhydrogenase subunit alpha